MIEINLLPQEYRVQERTPLGLILTVVLGMLTVGAIGIYALDLKNQLSNETVKNIGLQSDRDKFKAEADKIDKLEKEVALARKRQEAIIDISQSKIVWSQKLIQFGRIMQKNPDFWLDRLTLTKGSGGPKGGGTIACTFYALGIDMRNVALFREQLTGDINFWYHFDSLSAPRTTVQDKGGGPLSQYGYNGGFMSFGVTMALR